MAAITISRLPGAWGDALAEQLCRSLGYRLMDRSALLHAVHDLGVESLAEASPELSERSPSLFERLTHDRHRYVGALRLVMLEEVERDNVVIVGLGGGQLLRKLPQVVRTQVVAPVDVRVARLMAEGPRTRPGPLSLSEARDVLHRLDHDRAGYMRFMFHIDWLDPQWWDIVLNTGGVSLNDGVAILEAAAQRAAAHDSEASRARMRDRMLASRVEWSLLNSQAVWVGDLHVRAEAGVVVLEGHVLSPDEVELAHVTVAAVEGVRGIENRIQLQPFPYGPV